MTTLRNQTSTTVERSTGSRDLVRTAGWVGLVGPAIFYAVILFQYALRRGEYDAIAEPISGLGAGSLGWIQGVNFAVFGVLTIVFAVGLHRAIAPSRRGVLGPALIGVTGVGLITAAVFPLQRDAAGVLYDPGLHVVGGVMFFFGGVLAAATLVPRLRRDDRWRSLVPYTVTVAVVLAIMLPVVGIFARPEDAPLHDYGGVLQTVITAFRLPWQMVLGLWILRTTE